MFQYPFVRSDHISYIYIYIYIYVCVCVCVCVWRLVNLSYFKKRKKDSIEFVRIFVKCCGDLSVI